MASRPAVGALVLVAAAFLTGCHAGTSGNLAARPEPSLPKMTLTTTEAIQKHNANALRVMALEARPNVSLSSAQGGMSLRGNMALERPKSFKLQLSTLTETVADIGSNVDEFWFWTKSKGKKDNNVYVCSYEDIDRTPLSAAFQPDWIVEAMGLRSISTRRSGSHEIRAPATPTARPSSRPPNARVRRARS